jgi:hypothetical protein
MLRLAELDETEGLRSARPQTPRRAQYARRQAQLLRAERRVWQRIGRRNNAEADR